MRIADGHGRELDALVAEIERLRLLHFDSAHVELDVAVVPDDRLDLPRSDRQRDALGARCSCEPRRDDADTVARELGGRTIGIPDPDLRMRPCDGQDL